MADSTIILHINHNNNSLTLSRVRLAPKIQQQRQLGVGRSRSPLIPASSDPSNGGIGKHPTTTNNGSHPRFGRHDVFADIEYNVVAEELAAKARAGEFDTNDETEAPKTARLISEASREEEDMDLESEAHFEISLEEELNVEPVPLDILNPKEEVERQTVEPPPLLEEAGVLAADSVDSMTMDKHIQAAISEGGDGTEPSDVPDVDADADANTETNLTQIDSEVKLASRDELGTLIKILKSPLQSSSYSVLRQSARVSKRWDVPLSVLEQNANQPQGNEAMEPVEEGNQPCSALDSSGHSVAATAPISAR
jgi:hypothetical protein